MALAKFRKIYRQPIEKPKTQEEKKGEEPYRGETRNKDEDSSKSQ